MLRNTLTRAIRERRRITADYTPVRVGLAGRRTLEPYVLGVSRAGHLLLRAWVVNGASYSNRAGAKTAKARWRLFRVDGMDRVELGERRESIRPMYNQVQDAAMTRVIARVAPQQRPNTRAQAQLQRPNTRAQAQLQRPNTRAHTKAQL